MLQPLVRLSLYLSLMALGSTAATRFGKSDHPTPQRARTYALLDLVQCPLGTLRDADVCVPVSPATDPDGEALIAERNVHRTRHG
ncbi:MAG TPA: hypothetical protein VIV60_35840, partial [Polyangiaceae bacterium]